MEKYDIFISYRRSGGEYTAKILKDRLEDMGYKVFFDVESLRSGDFNKKLYSVIDECADFLIILSPGSLERTENEDDWVRLEIAHALKKEKNVIPVILRGFEFPPKLTEDIEPVRFKNGLEANSEFFDAFIQKLTKNFIKSKPNVHNRIRQNVVIRRIWPILLSLVIVSGLVAGGIVIFSGNSGQYPISKSEKNLTGEVMLYMQNNLTVANKITGDMDDAYKSCDNYLSIGDSISYQDALSAISTSYSDIDKTDLSQFAMNNQLSQELNNSPFNKADLQSLNSYIDGIKKSMLDDLANVKGMIDPDMSFDKATRKKWLDLERQWVDLFAHDIVYSTNMLLIHVSDSYLIDFKQKMLPEYTNLPYSELTWQKSEDELKRLLETNYSQSEDVVNKITEIVGKTNLSAQGSESELIKYAESLGLSEPDAEKYAADILAKTDDITKAKDEINKLKLKLDSELKEAEEKFAPLSTDEPGIIWSKMLRFLKLSLYDDAVKCAQVYQQKIRGTDANADTYMPVVIKFINQISDTGINYGLVVLGYEPGKQHPLYKIGDIVVAMNGNPCHTVEEMQSFIKSSDNVVTILRADEEGKLKSGDYNLPMGQCKVLFYNLSEEE